MSWTTELLVAQCSISLKYYRGKDDIDNSKPLHTPLALPQLTILLMKLQG